MSTAKNLISRYPEGTFILLLSPIVLLLASQSGITFRDFEVAFLPTLVLGGVWVWYATRGNDAKLSDFAYYPLMLLLAGVGGEVLSYVAVDPALPVYDDVLAGVDATLHFHWPDWLAFQHARPWYGRVMKLAYDSWVVQLYGSALYFALSGQQWRNRELLRIAIASSAFTLAIFYNFPALGPLVHFSVAPKLESFLHVVNLRAGIPLTLGPLDLQGLVSFPSFHTVMAMTFIYVHRGQGWLTWVVVGLNLTMLLATIVCGAHYLVDLLGGALVALVAIALVRMSMYTSEKRIIKPQPASPV